VTGGSPAALPDSPPSHARRLQDARVLLDLGELTGAEAEIAEVLEEDPEHLEALSLLAKVKHVRGELSLTVACQAQVEALRAAARPAARTHLESMLHLAQDPARGAGEFVAVGQFQLVKKPAAYLALEEAFHHYASRQPNPARAVCRRVAARYRAKDPEVYKLARLAESWISEMIGDLEAACIVLEALGNERGFETDLDRVLALVDLYERIGSPQRLEAAANVCRYLEHALEPISVLGRMAVLVRRLGRTAEAADYEARHLAAFRAAAHRATFEDLLRVAARRYLPLDRLLRVGTERADAPAGASGRERALASALAGELDEAFRRLERGDPLDRKYIADVELLRRGGDLDDEVARLYAEALAGDPRDLHVAGRLLDEHARRPRPATADPFRAVRGTTELLRTLERAVQLEPRNARLWRWLAVLFELQGGPGAQCREFAARAEALEQSAADAARVSGRSLAAAVYRLFGRVQGLMHEVWATRQMASAGHGGALQRDDVLGSLTDEMNSSVRSTFFAVRQYAQSKCPHATRDILDYRYFYKVTKDDEPSAGLSAGLPTALAFLSLFLQRPVPDDVASTGTIVADAHDVLVVRPVGDIDPKVAGAYHRNLRMIVVPAGNRAQLEHSSIVPRAVVHEIVRYASSLDDAARLVFGESVFL